MSWKDFLIRLAGFILIAIAAMPAFAIAFNLLILINAIPAELAESGRGNEVILRSVFVWTGCLPIGFAGIFIRRNWGKLFYFAPLYAPVLFALTYMIVRY